MEVWHIMPENDLKPHYETVRCHCKPIIQYEDNGKLVIHNSFDGREVYEDAEYNAMNNLN